MKTINEIRITNIKQLITEYGTQQKFADAIGKIQSQVGQWVNNHKSLGEKLAREIEHKLVLEAGYLDKDHDETHELADDTFSIPEYDVKCAANSLHGAEIIAADNIIRHHVLNNTFLIEYQVKKENLAVVRVVGDSMDPTLRDDERVIIDISKKIEIDNRVFALTTKNHAWVKRLRMTPSGYRWQSDNEEYRQYDNELNNGTTVRILGLVLYSLGRKVL